MNAVLGVLKSGAVGLAIVGCFAAGYWLTDRAMRRDRDS